MLSMKSRPVVSRTMLALLAIGGSACARSSSNSAKAVNPGPPAPGDGHAPRVLNIPLGTGLNPTTVPPESQPYDQTTVALDNSHGFNALDRGTQKSSCAELTTNVSHGPWTFSFSIGPKLLLSPTGEVVPYSHGANQAHIEVYNSDVDLKKLDNVQLSVAAHGPAARAHVSRYLGTGNGSSYEYSDDHGRRTLSRLGGSNFLLSETIDLAKVPDGVNFFTAEVSFSASPGNAVQFVVARAAVQVKTGPKETIFHVISMNSTGGKVDALPLKVLDGAAICPLIAVG